MHQYKTSQESHTLELVFEKSFTQDDLYLLAKELNDNAGECHIILDLSSIDSIDSHMMSAIIALKSAFGNIEIIGMDASKKGILSSLNIDSEFLLH